MCFNSFYCLQSSNGSWWSPKISKYRKLNIVAKVLFSNTYEECAHHFSGEMEHFGGWSAHTTQKTYVWPAYTRESSREGFSELTFLVVSCYTRITHGGPAASCLTKSTHPQLSKTPKNFWIGQILLKLQPVKVGNPFSEVTHNVFWCAATGARLWSEDTQIPTISVSGRWVAS